MQGYSLGSLFHKQYKNSCSVNGLLSTQHLGLYCVLGLRKQKANPPRDFAFPMAEELGFHYS